MARVTVGVAEERTIAVQCCSVVHRRLAEMRSESLKQLTVEKKNLNVQKNVCMEKRSKLVDILYNRIKSTTNKN